MKRTLLAASTANQAAAPSLSIVERMERDSKVHAAMMIEKVARGRRSRQEVRQRWQGAMKRTLFAVRHLADEQAAIKMQAAARGLSARIAVFEMYEPGEAVAGAPHAQDEAETAAMATAPVTTPAMPPAMPPTTAAATPAATGPLSIPERMERDAQMHAAMVIEKMARGRLLRLEPKGRWQSAMQRTMERQGNVPTASEKESVTDDATEAEREVTAAEQEATAATIVQATAAVAEATAAVAAVEIGGGAASSAPTESSATPAKARRESDVLPNGGFSALETLSPPKRSHSWPMMPHTPGSPTSPTRASAVSLQGRAHEASDPANFLAAKYEQVAAGQPSEGLDSVKQGLSAQLQWELENERKLTQEQSEHISQLATELANARAATIAATRVAAAVKVAVDAMEAFVSAKDKTVGLARKTADDFVALAAATKAYGEALVAAGRTYAAGLALGAQQKALATAEFCKLVGTVSNQHAAAVLTRSKAKVEAAAAFAGELKSAAEAKAQDVADYAASVAEVGKGKVNEVKQHATAVVEMGQAYGSIVVAGAKQKTDLVANATAQWRGEVAKVTGKVVGVVGDAASLATAAVAEKALGVATAAQVHVDALKKVATDAVALAHAASAAACTAMGAGVTGAAAATGALLQACAGDRIADAKRALDALNAARVRMGELTVEAAQKVLEAMGASGQHALALATGLRDAIGQMLVNVATAAGAAAQAGVAALGNGAVAAVKGIGMGIAAVGGGIAMGVLWVAKSIYNGLGMLLGAIGSGFVFVGRGSVALMITAGHGTIWVARTTCTAIADLPRNTGIALNNCLQGIIARLPQPEDRSGPNPELRARTNRGHSQRSLSVQGAR